MEGKKLYLIQPQFSLFFEKRFLLLDPPPEPAPAPSPDPEPEPAPAPVAPEGDRAGVRRGAARERRKARGKAERTELKKEAPKLPTLPEAPSLDKDVFVGKVESREMQNQLDRLKINVKREDRTINGQKWDHSTGPGLQKIMKDLQDLDIYNDPNLNNKPFYDTMFAHLKAGVDFRSSTPDLNIKNYLQDPARYYREIEAMAVPAGSSFDAESFLRAHEHLQYLKGVLLAQDHMQKFTHDKQRGADSEPISDKIGGFVKDNLRVMQKALKEKDWATVGMYGVAFWTMYKAFGQLTEGESGAKVKKWLIYGAAAYGGHLMLKNAGYDLLKMAGIRDKDYEVEGTPMEVMRNILRANPQLSEKDKDIDYGVVLQMSDVNLDRLNDLFEKTNEPAAVPQFIHPKEFPTIFDSKIVGQWPFKMGLAANASNDQTAMNNVNLSREQERYVELGQQIYKIALGLKTTYNDTLRTDHPAYMGATYEEAISGSRAGSRKLGKVRHLLDAVSPYSVRTAPRLFLKKKDKVEAELLKEFDFAPEANLSLSDASEGGHFPGRLKGFPIMVVPDGKTKFRFYLQNEYGDKDKPGSKYFTVDVGTADRRDATKVLTGIDLRMTELLGNITDSTGRKYDKMNYVGGQWEIEVKLPAASEFGITATTGKAIVEVDNDGKGLIAKMDAGGGKMVRIDVDEDLGKRFPLAVALGPKVLREPKFESLRVFNNAGLMEIQDPTGGDKKFMILLGKGAGKMKFEVEYDGTNFKFATPADEAALLKNPAFALEYAKALESDEHHELHKTMSDVKDLIGKAAPEEFALYFWKAMTQNTKSGPLDGVNFDLASGSIPENFTDMVLDTSKNEVYARLQHGISSATKLEDVEVARQRTLHDFNHKLKSIYHSISNKNADYARRGEKWDRDDFVASVINELRGASSVSSSYTESRIGMEHLLYNLPNLPGLGAKSDLSDTSHNTVRDLMKVYVHFTAHLDNHEYNGVAINLDTLTFPATPTPGIADPKVDPALRGHYIKRYLEFVNNSVYTKAATISDLSNVPSPIDNNTWRIPKFEDWIKSSAGNYTALNPLDDHPDGEFDHPAAEHLAGKHTELDKYLVGEYEKVRRTLGSEYPGLINDHAMQNYLYKKPVKLAPGGMIEYTPEHEIGITKAYTIPHGAGPHPAGTVLKFHSTIWDKTDRIASISGTQRSKQVDLVRQEMDNFIQHIFTAKHPNGSYVFFKQEPRLTTKMIRQWPWLRHILPN